MAKYSGDIGFGMTEEIRPGVFKPALLTKHYRGDVIQMSRTLQSAESVNDDITISVQISIVADSFATMNILNIKYATYMGAKWKVIKAEPARPRILLTLGGLYNGK